jgi:hypothetical protein
VKADAGHESDVGDDPTSLGHGSKFENGHFCEPEQQIQTHIQDAKSSLKEFA